jgi:SAM-dependent methyltransferase
VDEDLYPLYHREEDKWWWSVGRRALVTSLWHRFGSQNSRPKLLEVGCGTGGLLRELTSWADAYGLDLSTEAVGFCRERGLATVCRGSLNALPFRDDTFDGVIGVDVLEHLDDDEGAMRELLRVCRPGGRMVVTVPAFQFLWSRRDVQLHHRRRYRLPEFRGKVAEVGFQVLKTTYVNLPLFPPLLAMVKVGRLGRGGPNLKMDYALVPGPFNGLLSAIVRWEARLLARVSLPIGTSIACVAAKSGPTEQRPVVNN